jgi:hypothetical protein
MLLLEAGQLAAVTSIPLGQIIDRALLEGDLLLQQRLLLLKLRLRLVKPALSRPHFLFILHQLCLCLVDVALAKLLDLSIGGFKLIVDAVVLSLDELELFLE